MSEIPSQDIAALQERLLSTSMPLQITSQLSSTEQLVQGSLQHDADQIHAIARPGADKTTSQQDDILPTEVAESQNVDARHSQPAPTLLRSTKSEPSPAIAAMADSSPSKNPRLLATFNGAVGGDTQPFDTQVYRQYLAPTETPARPITIIESTTERKSMNDEDGTNLGTFNVGQGDSYMDLGNSWPEQASPTADQADADDMEDLLASPQTQMPHVPRHVTFPETPQLAGHKRTNEGEAITSVARSDALSAIGDLFGPAKTPKLSTTQLFQQTQARSSPLPDGLRSDPVLTRPSPNMQEHAMLTSNPGYSSSPVLHRDDQRGADDLRNTYVSMRESQARRAQSRSALPDVTEEDEDDYEVLRLQQMHMRRAARDNDCRNVTAPERPSSSARRNNLPLGYYSSPMKLVQQGGPDPIVVDEDEPLSPAPEEDADDDDQYDELGQTVLRSQVEGRADDDEDETMLEDEDETAADQHTAFIPRSQDASEKPHATQQPLAGPSQIVPQSEKRSLLAPAHQESSNNVIPGSQFASQQFVRHSQPVLLQPSQRAASSPLRVPSSPPIVAANGSDDTPSKAATAPADVSHKDTEGESGSGRVYTTAHSHSSPQRLNETIQGSVPTPLKAAGALHYAEIGIPSQRSMNRYDSGELEVSEVAGVLFTNEDREYNKLMSSPVAANPRKRRKVVRTVQSSDPQPTSQLEHSSADPDLPAIQVEDATDLADAPDTPPSIRRREAAGSATVDELLAHRSPEDTFMSKLSGPGKRTYKDRSKRSSAQKVTDTPASPRSRVLAVPSPAPTLMTTPLRPPVLEDGTAVVHADRVFAWLGGKFSKFFPALHFTEDGRDQARFDDGTVADLGEHVPLDLRIGDVVKIDLPNMRVDWTIEGFEADDAATAASSKTDIYGHSTIRIRQQNAKTKSAPSVAANEDGTYSISVANIYLSKKMADACKNRALPNTIARPSTPARDDSTTASTPHSRSGRKATRRLNYAPPSSSVVSEATIRTPVSVGAGVFSNMAFAITLQADGSEQKDLFRLIAKHGGIVLDTGFDELFEPLQHGESPETLTVKTKYQRLTFVALIADKHGRTGKYMQALALGLPTLSTRWVLDTTKRAKAAEALPWTKYLLPAGDSAFLETVRSRTLQPYQPVDAVFTNTIARRDLLLDGAKVLLEMSTKARGGSTYDRRKSYAFLAVALGAAHVRGVADFAKAYSIHLDDKSWSWICVDGDIDASERDLVLGEGKVAGKKRKKTAVNEPGGYRVNSKDGDLSVIGTEFIAQSLILGALVE